MKKLLDSDFATPAALIFASLIVAAAMIFAPRAVAAVPAKAAVPTARAGCGV